MSNVLLEMRNICKSYPLPGGKRCSVLNNISFKIHAGEAMGLLGPSGSGKSTIARIVLGLDGLDNGEVLFIGKSVSKLSGRKKRDHFRNVQMVWQDPTIYLNPYQNVLTAIKEPLDAFKIGPKKDRVHKAKELMEILGLSSSLEKRKPGQLSGGQCQRVAIARALAVSPKLLICDEALVNLDLPQQVEILRLLKRLEQDFHLSILFISHDRDAVKKLCHRTFVMAANN